jgi:hypothetical protein
MPLDARAYSGLRLLGRTEGAMMPPTPIEERLVALHAHYIRRVNAAVAAGRMDLVQDLADGCEDEALELMLTVEGDISGPSQVEILEIDGGWPQWQGRRSWPPRRRFWQQRKDR